MLCCFFFNDTATTEIYTLSLHDALPISLRVGRRPRARVPDMEFERSRLREPEQRGQVVAQQVVVRLVLDRKSTRLNSSHSQISYAVFCLKKKKENLLCAGHALPLPHSAP